MRRKEWEDRLAAYIGQHREAIFEYGRLDCVLFAAGAIEALTGEDPAAHIRGGYETRIGSLRVLHREGHADLVEMMDVRFGTVPLALAQRGDIVMAGGSLGVCMGRFALFVGEDTDRPGLVGLPITAWQLAWRIPFNGETERRD